jgi:hypothetical protein
MGRTRYRIEETSGGGSLNNRHRVAPSVSLRRLGATRLRKHVADLRTALGKAESRLTNFRPNWIGV